MKQKDRKLDMIVLEQNGKVIFSNQIMRRVNHRAGALYDFLMVAGGMINALEMECHGCRLTILEIRTIMLIKENPGITATDICKRWNRTRGAISQMLKKIEDKGFIYKEKDGKNDRITHLFATDWGVDAVNIFTINDFRDDTYIIEHLLEFCSEDELRAFYKVIDCYRKILLEHPETRWAHYSRQD